MPKLEMMDGTQLEILEVFGLDSVDIRPLDPKELERFDKGWDRLTSIFDTPGRQSYFDQVDKNTALVAAMAYKKFSGKEFQGVNPKTGFGFRWAMPDDVFSQAGDVLYDHNWATAGRRNWMAGVAVDVGTYEAATYEVLRDVALQDHWTMLMYGIKCDHPSPKVKAFYMDINHDDMPIQHIEPNIRNSEHHLHKFGVAYYIPPNTPFKTGLLFETGALGQDAVRPVALTFITSTRALDLTINRPVAV